MQAVASGQANCRLSHKRTVAPVRPRGINSLRDNDAGHLARAFTALYGQVYLQLQDVNLEIQELAMDSGRKT
jgi:hypothetical protein